MGRAMVDMSDPLLGGRVSVSLLWDIHGNILMSKCLKGNPIIATVESAMDRVSEKLRACGCRQRTFGIYIKGIY